MEEKKRAFQGKHKGGKNCKDKASKGRRDRKGLKRPTTFSGSEEIDRAQIKKGGKDRERKIAKRTLRSEKKKWGRGIQLL